LMCRQVTWAVINDSRQYFFCTVTADHFSSGQVRWPTSLLMQVIGADIQACRGITMGNFPEKWMENATIGSYLRTQGEKRNFAKAGAQFAVPVGLPPPAPAQWPQPLPGPTSAIPDNAASGQGNRPVTIRPSDVHPAITEWWRGTSRIFVVYSCTACSGPRHWRRPIYQPFQSICSRAGTLCAIRMSLASVKERCVDVSLMDMHQLRM
jgi:hypothetical protein